MRRNGVTGDREWLEGTAWGSPLARRHGSQASERPVLRGSPGCR